MENDELLPEFLAEANELIERVYQDLAKLDSEKDIAPLFDALFRNIHTVKGGSSMFGFVNTQAVAHKLESFLSQLKSATPLIATPENIQFIREETQKIEALLKNSDKPAQETAPGEAPIHAEAIPQAEAASVPTELSQASPAPASTPSSASATSPDYIRVPVQRINEAMNCISEIFLIRNQMVHLMERRKSNAIDQRDFYQNWDQLDGALRRGIGELERSTMTMRMASVQALFSRMARVIQSYKAENKKIEFHTEGEATELDKKVLDTLSEPLVHLIRNSMDHGIETIDVRTQRGKQPHGKVTLRAAIVGNEAVIEVSDDGKGMDSQAIVASAKKKGIDTSHVTDEKSAIDLIFLPGFSTAQSVSEISGRGVGMDAVKTSVQNLGGKIQIQTKVGLGSTFTIRLPVSVSVSPVVIVNIRGFKYAIPNHDILEIRQTGIQNVRKNAGKHYVSFRDSLTECIDLREVVKTSAKDHEENLSEASFIFFKNEEKVYAARVSSFEGNTEIVVKPVSKVFPVIPWVGGVSVLPTGEVIFVFLLSRVFEKDSPQEVNHVAA